MWESWAIWGPSTIQEEMVFDLTWWQKRFAAAWSVEESKGNEADEKSHLNGKAHGARSMQRQNRGYQRVEIL